MDNTTIYWHPAIFLHDLAAGHVAMDPYRIKSIFQEFATCGLGPLVQSRQARWDEFLRFHDDDYLQQLAATRNLAEGAELAFNRETILNRHTWLALEHSAGAVCQAIDDVLALRTRNAFCVTYAGHHAGRGNGGGFCFTNQIGIGAEAALAAGLSRIAILDFDTHSGNGTLLSFPDKEGILFAETYQKGYPGILFDGSGRPDNVLREKCNSPNEFTHGWTRLLRKVADFSPQLVLVSAGFDAHRTDPLGTAGLSDSHYAWIARAIAAIGVPVVAALEGGYNVESTARCAVLFARELARVTAENGMAPAVA